MREENIEKAYKAIGTVSLKLRKTMPFDIREYRFQVTADGLSVTERLTQATYQERLIQLLLNGQTLVRRCKACETVFAKNRRQAYCSKKCSQLARMRKFRSMRQNPP